jgi:hypothetical protein
MNPRNLTSSLPKLPDRPIAAFVKDAINGQVEQKLCQPFYINLLLAVVSEPLPDNLSEPNHIAPFVNDFNFIA